MFKLWLTPSTKSRILAPQFRAVQFQTEGMIIAPCSIRSLSEIATGVTSSLLTRAADVVLKERRRLVLLVRETPLHTGHLRSMVTVSEIGAVVMPPVPAFYTRPTSVEEDSSSDCRPGARSLRDRMWPCATVEGRPGALNGTQRCGILYSALP